MNCKFNCIETLFYKCLENVFDLDRFMLHINPDFWHIRNSPIHIIFFQEDSSNTHTKIYETVKREKVPEKYKTFLSGSE